MAFYDMVVICSVYFRINHMLNIRSIRKKMVDLLGQEKFFPLMWTPYGDSKAPLKCKTLFYATCHLSGEIFSADVDALWRLKSSLLLVEIFMLYVYIFLTYFENK
ncbi:unnamed protein product [Brassica rapa subsp. trilocularis]